MRPEIEGLGRGKADLLVTADRLIYNPDSPQPYAYELRLDESARPRAYSIHLLPNSRFEGNGASRPIQSGRRHAYRHLQPRLPAPPDRVLRAGQRSHRSLQ